MSTPDVGPTPTSRDVCYLVWRGGRPNLCRSNIVPAGRDYLWIVFSVATGCQPKGPQIPRHRST